MSCSKYQMRLMPRQGAQMNQMPISCSAEPPSGSRPGQPCCDCRRGPVPWSLVTTYRYLAVSRPSPSTGRPDRRPASLAERRQISHKHAQTGHTRRRAAERRHQSACLLRPGLRTRLSFSAADRPALTTAGIDIHAAVNLHNCLTTPPSAGSWRAAHATRSHVQSPQGRPLFRRHSALSQCRPGSVSERPSPDLGARLAWPGWRSSQVKDSIWPCVRWSRAEPPGYRLLSDSPGTGAPRPRRSR